MDGCANPSKARGLCHTHWARWRKNGDPSVVRYIRDATLEQKFWFRVQKTDTCWRWTGSLIRGYGHIGIREDDGKWHLRRAHRVAYELLVGPIPEGLTIDHLCNVKHCVNPAHLEPVTTQENTRRRDVRMGRVR